MMEDRESILERVKKGLEESVGGLGDEAMKMIKRITEEDIIACAVVKISDFIVNNSR